MGDSRMRQTLFFPINCFILIFNKFLPLINLDALHSRNVFLITYNYKNIKQTPANPFIPTTFSLKVEMSLLFSCEFRIFLRKKCDKIMKKHVMVGTLF